MVNRPLQVINMQKAVCFLLFLLTSTIIICASPLTNCENENDTIKKVQGPDSENIVFSQINKDGYNYQSNGSLYQFDVKTRSNFGDGSRFTVDGYSLIYQPQDISYRDNKGAQDYISSVQDVIGQVNGKTISYSNVFTGVTLTYTLLSNQVKENFILNAKPRAPAAYLDAPTLDFGGYIKYGSLKIFVNGVEQKSNFKTNQSIAFGTSSNSIVYRLPTPLAVDAKGNTLVLEYEVKAKGGQIWFYVRTPYSWLQKAVYPVAVDPTIRVQGYSVAEYEDIDTLWNDTPTETNTTGFTYTNATMIATPTVGNTLIACGGIFDQVASNSLNAINQTGVIWERVNSTVKEDYASRYIGSEIWKGYVTGPTVDDNIVFNFTVNSQYSDGEGVPSNAGWYNKTSMQFDVCEYNNLPQDSIDQSATNTGTSTPLTSTGTTPTTAQAVELWIGTISFGEYSAVSTPQNGFTLLDDGESDGYQPAVVYLEKVVSSVGTAQTGVTFPSNFDYAACVATFLSKPPPTYSGLTASNTVANSSCVFSLTADDEIALHPNGQYEFGTNNTGAWEWEAAANFTTTPQTVNVSKTLNSTVGSVVAYQWNFTNNEGTTNTTGVQTFTTVGYYITISNDTHSTVNATSPQVLPYGGEVAIEFTADAGYSIQTVIINQTYSANTTSPYVFSNVQGNQSIAISTSDTIYYINATASTGATIYPSGTNLMYPYETWANFTCSASGGYTLDNFYINGTAAGTGVLTGGEYNFMPTGNTTLYLSAVAVSNGNGASGGISNITPTPTTTITPLTNTTTKASPNNFLFVVGISMIILLAATLVYSRNASRKVKSEIKSWNT